MSRYKKLFKNLSSIREGAFVPFVMIGDPSIDISIKIIETLIANGADALELGIPFSDPLADGPTIQKSNIRALSNRNTFLKYYQVLTKLRHKYINIPIGILIYANLIYNQGIKNFYFQCSQAGIDSVLIADVPIEESYFFYKKANIYNIDSIFICPPDADDIFLDKITQYAKGYIYLLSRPGVTGIENNNISVTNNLITKLKKRCNIPFLQGFGISNAIQIKKILKTGISGVICGSIIINIIEKYLYQEDKMINEIKIITDKLKKATRLIY